MRVGACLLYCDGLCYQSYGWNMMRPLGGIQHAVNMLEEYQVDEISIIRPVRNNDNLSCLKSDIEKLKKLRSMTPLSLGGGIRTESAIELISDLPIERLILSSAFIDSNSSLIKMVTNKFGRQAIQAFLPVRFESGSVSIFNSLKNIYIPLSEVNLEFCIDYANEIIIHDLSNEGVRGGFDINILSALKIPADKTIVSGGVGENTVAALRNKHIAAVLIENRVLHNEYSVGVYRND